MLTLRALGAVELRGLGVSRRVEQITQGTFLVKPGSLFPAVHRMEEAGWLSSFWGESENNRRAKFYRLTKAGKGQLEVEMRGYVDMMTDEKIAGGMLASEARRTALAEFGGIEQVKQTVRDH